MLTVRDNTRLYYKDWGSGPAVLFSHGWPLNSDMWENQMMHLASEGYRVIAHDRRGFGRSDQPWHGYDHDTFSEDLSEIINAMDLREVTLVGYAMGGGEITRYIGRHGTDRISRIVLIGATTPKLAWSDDYPNGVPEAVFDGVRAGLKADRAEFIRGFSRLFFGADRDGATVSEGSMMQLHQIAMQSSLKAAHDLDHRLRDDRLPGRHSKVRCPGPHHSRRRRCFCAVRCDCPAGDSTHAQCNLESLRRRSTRALVHSQGSIE